MISYQQVSVAIHYLFPTLKPDSSHYKKIADFIHEEYARIGTSVLYYRNKAFMDLISSLSLSIGNSEVIITDCTVRATKNYSLYPQIIFER